MSNHYRKVEVFTPAERTKRNARMGAAIGRFLGFGLLATPLSLIAGACAVREAWQGVDRTPNPDHFKTELFKSSERQALAARMKGDDDDE